MGGLKGQTRETGHPFEILAVLFAKGALMLSESQCERFTPHP